MSFETEVNAAIKAATTDDKGKTTYPKGTSEAVVYAANAEKRRRDTQASYVKEQQRADKLESENVKLADTWAAEVAQSLTSQQRAELEELKNTDAEAWREKLNKYESDNNASTKEKQKKIKEQAHEETELQRRTRVLDEYNKANPDKQLTDELIDNDLPPRITKKLADGKITFDEFITEAATYLGTPKVIANGDDANGDPDLSDSGGKETPSEESVDKEASESYKNEVY